MTGYSCPGCGAAVDAGAERCEYCGNPFLPNRGSGSRAQAQRKIAELEATASRNPNNAQHWQDLGAAYHQKGDYARAEEALQRACALRPKEAQAFYLLAWNMGVKNGWECPSVAEFAERAAALDPQLKSAQALIHLSRGVRIYLSDHSNDGLANAVDEFRVCVKLDPKNTYAFYYAAWAYELGGNLDTAADLFEKAGALALEDLAPDREDARIFAHLGQLYARLERKDEARKAFRQALALDQDNLAAQKQLQALDEKPGLAARLRKIIGSEEYAG